MVVYLPFSKRPPFKLRKAAFCIVKAYLLEPKRIPFITSLIINVLHRRRLRAARLRPIFLNVSSNMAFYSYVSYSCGNAALSSSIPNKPLTLLLPIRVK